MARRIRKSAWGTTLLRSLGTLTRATLRSGARALKQAARKKPRRAAKKTTVRVAKRVATKAVKQAGSVAAPIAKAIVAPIAAPIAKPLAKPLAKPTTRPRSKPLKTRRPGVVPSAGWSSGVAVVAGTARRYRLYRPPGPGARVRLPLLVMLHGCQQNAERFERSARLQRLAAQLRFCVLYPDQERMAHPQGCWNWYEMRSGRACSEAATILAQIDQLCERQIADPARVAVAGLSAGASMAALLGLRYPQRFKAVAMHSGIGPGAAQSSSGVLAAMHGRRAPSLPPRVDGDPTLPPLLVIQGTLDAVVRAPNGRAIAQVWAEQRGAHALPVRTAQRGQRYPVAVTDFKVGARIAVSLCEVQGLGHAWSGGAPGQPFSDPKGPDASRMVWAFAAREFRRGR